MTIIQATLLSLKEVTLEEKWFGLSGDQQSFPCVTRWTLGDDLLGHRKHTWKGSSVFCTCDITRRLVASRLCVVLTYVTMQWGCQDRPTWCGWGRGNSVSWHAGRWLQHYLEQIVLLDRWMCPTGLWMQSCNDLVSGSEFGYIQKIHPWRKRPHVRRMHR